MLKIVPSNQFKKDLKLAKKRGCKIECLRNVVNTLARGQKLDEKYHDHISKYSEKFRKINYFKVRQGA